MSWLWTVDAELVFLFTAVVIFKQPYEINITQVLSQKIKRSCIYAKDQLFN